MPMKNIKCITKLNNCIFQTMDESTVIRVCCCHYFSSSGSPLGVITQLNLDTKKCFPKGQINIIYIYIYRYYRHFINIKMPSILLQNLSKTFDNMRSRQLNDQ